jgi:hypothetical protein
MLAKYNSKQVEFLAEVEKKNPDLKFDNQTWDIKYIDKANENTIRSDIKNARKADNAIFYFTDESKYALLNNAINREVGRFLKGHTNKPKISISTLIHPKNTDFCRINARYFAYYKRITITIF